jgi:RNA-directed DNA polymerase
VGGTTTEAPGPKDKLDAAATVAVNGPDDAILDSHAIDWRQAEDGVRRLRQGVFAALQAGPALLPAYEPTGLV